MEQYAVVQTLNFDGMGGEWLETEIIFQGSLEECKDFVKKTANDFVSMYIEMYNETDVLALPIDKYSIGMAYHVGCLDNPTLWAEFIIAEISLDKRD